MIYKWIFLNYSSHFIPNVAICYVRRPYRNTTHAVKQTYILHFSFSCSFFHSQQSLFACEIPCLFFFTWKTCSTLIIVVFLSTFVNVFHYDYSFWMTVKILFFCQTTRWKNVSCCVEEKKCVLTRRFLAIKYSLINILNLFKKLFIANRRDNVFEQQHHQNHVELYRYSID